MDPLGSTAGGLEGPPSLGAEQTFGLDTQSAGPTQPVPLGYLKDAITCLGWEDRDGCTLHILAVSCYFHWSEQDLLFHNSKLLFHINMWN